MTPNRVTISDTQIPATATNVQDMGNGWKKYSIDNIWFMTDGKQTVQIK
jgi:hypothetical protein